MLDDLLKVYVPQPKEDLKDKFIDCNSLNRPLMVDKVLNLGIA
jgi:hypothetical protein